MINDIFKRKGGGAAASRKERRGTVSGSCELRRCSGANGISIQSGGEKRVITSPIAVHERKGGGGEDRLEGEGEKENGRPLFFFS